MSAARVAVVGSGPAGVAASRALLDGGHAVEMLDVGYEIEPEAHELAARLRAGAPEAEDRRRLQPDRAQVGPAAFVAHLFASLTGRAPILNLMEKGRLGSLFTFRGVEEGIPAVGGGAPLARSLARGGLSNVWGAACYPLTEEEHRDWPVGARELAPHYRAAAEMLSLIQVDDDLASVYPIHGAASDGLPLNPPAAALSRHWSARRDTLADDGVRFGRARLAVREPDVNGAGGCQLCGLCLSGCPHDAIYRADWTLAELERHPNFRYRAGWWVRRCAERPAGVDVIASQLDTGLGGLDGLEGKETETLGYDAVFLAAGTLSSLRIAAESRGAEGRETRILDNDLYLLPLLRSGGGLDGGGDLRFTLNELALRKELGGCPLHIQLYCMSAQVVDRFRPLLGPLPGRVRERLESLLSRLMLAFVYLPGDHSAHLAGRVEPGPAGTRVELSWRRNRESARIARRAAVWMARRSRALGLLPLMPPLRCTPAGHSGGHLAGALPMRDRPGLLECDARGVLSGQGRIHVVDGAALPTLPAQNSTYTIMANAHRIGSAFGREGAE